MEHISLISRAEGGSISPNMAVSIYQTGDPEDDNIKTQSEQHVPYQRRNISTTRGNAVTIPNSMCRIRDARYEQLVVMLLPVRTACAVSETQHRTARGNAVTSPKSICRIRNQTYRQLVVILLPVRTACALSETQDTNSSW